MINLLPAEGKKGYVREYYLRVGIVACTFLAAIFAMNIALLAPSYVSLLARENAIAVAKQNVQAEFDQEAADQAYTIIELTNKEVAALYRSKDTVRVSDLFKKIAEHQNGSIEITGLYFNGVEGAKEGNSLVVNGRASRREDLVGFSERLESEGIFSKVDVPVSDLVRETNVPFSLKITGAF